MTVSSLQRSLTVLASGHAVAAAASGPQTGGDRLQTEGRARPCTAPPTGDHTPALHLTEGTQDIDGVY